MPDQETGNGEHEDRKEGDEEGTRDLELVERDDGSDEEPSDHAAVRFERDGVKVEARVPGWAVAMVGPWLTLSVLPETFPAWMTFTLLLAQLAVSVRVRH